MLSLLFFAAVNGWSLPSVTPSKVECEGKAGYPVHLTFDDGPTWPGTKKILDELKKRGIKATFMLSTSHFPSLESGQPPTEKEKKLIALVERMKREGHTVGNHSFEHIAHADLSKVSPDEAEENLEKSFRVIKALKLKKPFPFRFPYGSGWFTDRKAANRKQADAVIKKVKQNHFIPMHWDVDTWDWSKIKRKALPDSLLNQICTHEGGVVLMHDVQPFEQQNVGALIDSILNSNHRIVSNAQIRAYSNSKATPLSSLSDHAAGVFTCRRPVSDLDQIWPTCKDYLENSSDVPEANQ